MDVKMANVVNRFRVLVMLIALVLMYDINNAQNTNTLKDSTETFLDVCNAAVKSECIEKCYFKDKNLIIDWCGSKYKSVNQPDRKVKKVKNKI
jgi:hypothetical protein